MQSTHALQGVRSVRSRSVCQTSLAQPFLHIVDFFAPNANLTGHFTPHHRLRSFCSQADTSHPLLQYTVTVLPPRCLRTGTLCACYTLRRFCGLVRCNSLRFLLKSAKMFAVHGIAHYAPNVANTNLLRESNFFILRTFCSSATRSICQSSLCSVKNFGS